MTAIAPQQQLSEAERQKIRREEQERAERVLLRVIARTAVEWLDARPGGTTRALESAVRTWQAWLAGKPRGRGRGKT